MQHRSVRLLVPSTLRPVTSVAYAYKLDAVFYILLFISNIVKVINLCYNDDNSGSYFLK